MAVDETDRDSSECVNPDPEGDRHLAIYLQDHRAGASAGSALATRFADANASTVLGDAAAELSRQIAEDVQTLDEIIERCDLRPSRAKMAAARAAELLGRLKFNGRFGRYSPLSRLLDIELLSAGILTKESLWKSLAILQEGRPRAALTGVDFGVLQRRAQRQRELLESCRRDATTAAFAIHAPRVPGEPAGTVPCSR